MHRLKIRRHCCQSVQHSYSDLRDFVPFKSALSNYGSGRVGSDQKIDGFESGHHHNHHTAATTLEDELRYHLGLTGVTTGKGKVNLQDSSVRPLEIINCHVWML